MTRKQFVGVKLSPELLARIDALADARSVGRSEAIRLALEAGLADGVPNVEKAAREAVDAMEAAVVDPPVAEVVARGKARAVKAVAKSSGRRQVETMFKGGK